jgi:hypothetical protein
MKPEAPSTLIGEQGRLPDATGAGLLVAAATIYLTLRQRNPDVEQPGLSIYSLWGMAVSLGLGILGGWVFWAVQPAYRIGG